MHERRKAHWLGCVTEFIPEKKKASKKQEKSHTRKQSQSESSDSLMPIGRSKHLANRALKSSLTEKRVLSVSSH